MTNLTPKEKDEGTNLAPKEKNAGGSKTSQEKKRKAGPYITKRKKEKTLDVDNLPKDIQLKLNDDRVIILTQPQEMRTGGRVGYKMGSKCKLAKRGKGRAYGKNS